MATVSYLKKRDKVIWRSLFYNFLFILGTSECTFCENEQSRWCSTSWKLFITLVLVHFCTFYPRADDSREWRWVIYLWVIHREGQVLNCHFPPTLPSLVLNSSPFRSPYNTGWWSKIDTGWFIRYWSDASSLLLLYCDEVWPNSQQGWLDQIRRRSGDGLRLLQSQNFTIIYATMPTQQPRNALLDH